MVEPGNQVLELVGAIKGDVTRLAGVMQTIRVGDDSDAPRHVRLELAHH